MKLEFITLEKATEEVEWLCQFLEDIILRWSKHMPIITIYYDSQSVIGKTQSNMYNSKSRHVRRTHNTIRQLLSSGVVAIILIIRLSKSYLRVSWSSIERNEFKTYEREMYHKGKSNLVVWRFQDLDSMGQPNCVYLRKLLWSWKNSYPFFWCTVIVDKVKYKLLITLCAGESGWVY